MYKVPEGGEKTIKFMGKTISGKEWGREGEGSVGGIFPSSLPWPLISREDKGKGNNGNYIHPCFEMQ